MRVRRVEGRRASDIRELRRFSAIVEFIPALKLGVAVLSNADDGNPASYCDYALQLLTPIAAKAAARAQAPVEDSERYCGVYRARTAT